MKWLVSILIILLALLQYRLWLADDSLVETWRLEDRVEQQRKENAALEERNRALEAEVRDLKQGLAAIEERARTEMGMIKQDEAFYQIVEDKETGDAKRSE